MPYVKTSRPCKRCHKVPGLLFGLDGGGVPELCSTCFNGGKGVIDIVASWLKRVRA